MNRWKEMKSHDSMVLNNGSYSPDTSWNLLKDLINQNLNV